MRLSRILTGLCASTVLALAQYPPGQYPPGQYPPVGYPPTTYPGGGYPPNTYPGGGYPPNTYPGRLPGGIPVPEVKLPRKEKKPENEVKVMVASVEGALRRLGEKDLVLQTGPKKLLRFRLLAKTQFKNKEGEPVRDSLLHPGDQLSVQVNTDDEETALRVTLLRSGTAAERASAELPFDASSVRAPRAEDLGKAKSTTVQQTETAADSDGGTAAAPATDGASGA